MSYNYNINAGIKDKRSTACLITCHTLSEISNYFVSTFLVAYIYAFSGSIFDYILNVGIYNLVSYVVFFLLLIPLGKWVDKTNRIWPYRISLVIRTALVVVAIYCGKDISKMLILAGFLHGCSSAFYYSSYNTLRHEMVSRKSMKSFMVLSQVLTLFIGTAIPLVLGAIIDVSSYAKASILVIIVCAIQIILSFFVKSQKPENSSFSLKNYFSKLKLNADLYKKMKSLYIIDFVYGFGTLQTILLNVCIILQFGSNFTLGALTSVFSVLSMISVLLFNKLTKPGKRFSLYLLSFIVPTVCIIWFVISPTWISLVSYNVAVAICGITYKTSFEIYRNGILKETGFYNEITEHQTTIELLICFARIISFALMILIALFNNLTMFYIFLCLSSLVGIMALMISRFEKKHALNSTEEKEDN